MTTGRQLRGKLSRLIRTAKYINSEAYSLNEDAYLQMQSLQLQIKDVCEFMESLKQEPGEDNAQQILLLDSITPKSTEDHHVPM